MVAPLVTMSPFSMTDTAVASGFVRRILLSKAVCRVDVLWTKVALIAMLCNGK
jgi:hypothetical protein